MGSRLRKLDTCWEFSKTLVEEHGRVLNTHIGQGHIMTLTYADGHKLIIDERCSEVSVSLNVRRSAENSYFIDIDSDDDTTTAVFRVTKDNQATILFTLNEDGSLSFSNGLSVSATGDVSLGFGDLVSEQNPDGADAIRIKGTDYIDVVIGGMTGLFAVWNVADNTAVFYVDERGDTDIAGDLTVSSLTKGSIPFVGANGLISQDNSNLFWDDTNKRLGIGIAVPLAVVHAVGQILLSHTAVEADDHAFEIDVDAAGKGDVKAQDIVYTTGAIVDGQDEAVILLTIDESQAAGGDVAGVETLATEGDADIFGSECGINVAPVKQLSGAFGDMDSALSNAANVLTSFITAGNDVEIFSALNDTVTIGNTDKFEEIEFLLAIVASGAGIKPTFSSIINL